MKSHKRSAIKVISFLIIVVFAFLVSAQDRAGDSLALVELYDSCNGENWTISLNWKSSQPINTWFGVKVVNDRVDTLRIGNRGAAGDIPASFGNLTELKMFFGINSAITSLPNTIGRLNKLEKILLMNNSLISLPDSIAALQNLTMLNLENNNIEFLPEEFGGLVSLDTLNLKGNSLDSLPESFGSLKSLINANFDNNTLVKLPESFGDLESIEIFTAQNNSIASLPLNIGNQKTITSLILNDNEISNIPASLGNLSSLQYLFLNNNNITSLPDDLSGMDSIRTILLINNEINSIGDMTFNNVVNLERLDIRGNSLSTLPDNMATMTSLNHLDIGDNQFTDVPGVIFNIPLLSKLLVDKNGYLFDDLELVHSSGIEGIGLSPQDSIGIAEYVYSFSGRLLTLNMPSVGTQNIYRWYYNGNPIDTNNETSSLHFDSLLVEDVGVYNCHVESDSVANIRLLQRPLFLYVINDLELKADSLPHAAGLSWINPGYDDFGRYIIWADGVLLDTLNSLTDTSFIVEGLEFNKEILFVVTIENVDGSVSLSDTVGGVLLNNAPVIDSADSQVINEDSSIVIDLSMLYITDTDDSIFTIQIGNGSNYSFQDNVVFPHENFNGLLNVNVRVNDGTDFSNSFAIPVEISAVNDAPFVKYPFPDTTFIVDEGKPFYAPFPDSIFDDIDIKDSVLSLHSQQGDGSALPSWLTFGAGYFSGIPVYDGYGLYEISVIAEDLDGATAEINFKLKVDPAVEIISIKDDRDTSEFICYPNPVSKDDEEIYFKFPRGKYQHGSISICTAMGTILDRIDCSFNESLLYKWNLKNKDGLSVGSGTYVIVLHTVNEFGKSSTIKKYFGVQR